MASSEAVAQDEQVPPGGEDGPVVVGVDGSPESAEALRWAADYARLVGAPLHVVIAWEHNPGFSYVPEGARLGQDAEHTLDRTIEKVLGASPPLRVVKQVVHGHSTPVLVEASRGARLLVVGDRGYGGFAGLLLGHCGENCVRHASCSVIVVRDHRRP